MELSRPVVVQHHGHLILTLDFQGQILKMLYLRNGRADWHGTKGMWIDRMLHPLCDVQHCPHPMTLTLDFQGQIFKKSYLRNGMADWHGMKGMWIDKNGLMLWLLMSTSPMTLTLDFQGQILKKSYLMNGMAYWHGTKGMWVDR